MHFVSASNLDSLNKIKSVAAYNYDFVYTANVNRQTTDKLLFSHAIITDENM